VVEVLAQLRAAEHPGIMTGELDARAAAILPWAGARASFLGYHGYPAALCAFVNDESAEETQAFLETERGEKKSSLDFL